MPKGILLLESGSRIRPLQNPALNKSMNDPHASLTEHEHVGISQYEAIRKTSHEEPLMRPHEANCALPSSSDGSFFFYIYMA